MLHINSLTPGGFAYSLKLVNFKLISKINILSVFCEIAIRWMSEHLTDHQSTLVQVMAWCRQATSHYLSQCWPRSLLPLSETVDIGVHVVHIRQNFLSWAFLILTKYCSNESCYLYSLVFFWTKFSLKRKDCFHIPVYQLEKSSLLSYYKSFYINQELLLYKKAVTQAKSMKLFWRQGTSRYNRLICSFARIIHNDHIKW